VVWHPNHASRQHSLNPPSQPANCPSSICSLWTVPLPWCVVWFILAFLRVSRWLWNCPGSPGAYFASLRIFQKRPQYRIPKSQFLSSPKSIPVITVQGFPYFRLTLWEISSSALRNFSHFFPLLPRQSPLLIDQKYLLHLQLLTTNSSAWYRNFHFSFLQMRPAPRLTGYSFLLRISRSLCTSLQHRNLFWSRVFSSLKIVLAACCLNIWSLRPIF